MLPMREVGPRASLQWSDESGPSSFLSPSQFKGVPDATQRRILEYIASHPGAYLRQVCRDLGLAMGDVQYHVHRLERDGRISSTRRGLHRFFYPSTLFGDRQRDVLSMLALDTPRELLLHIVDKPDSGQDQLSSATALSQPTVSWHLKRLVEMGIVERRQTGRSVTYAVPSERAAEIASFIRSYHPTVWGRWSSRLADIFISYSRSEGVDEKKR